MEEALIGRETDGMQFMAVKRGPDGEIWYVSARLRVAGLDASLRVSAHYATGFDDLVRFFRSLASDWRGWDGERTYESLERELRLTAVHHGHVSIKARLRPSVPDGWSATATFGLDPGEEMTRVADEVEGLLGSVKP